MARPHINALLLPLSIVAVAQVQLNRPPHLYQGLAMLGYKYCTDLILVQWHFVNLLVLVAMVTLLYCIHCGLRVWHCGI